MQRRGELQRKRGLKRRETKNTGTVQYECSAVTNDPELLLGKSSPTSCPLFSRLFSMCSSFSSTIYLPREQKGIQNYECSHLLPLVLQIVLQALLDALQLSIHVLERV
jgi:hypothetical protein